MSTNHIDEDDDFLAVSRGHQQIASVSSSSSSHSIPPTPPLSHDSESPLNRSFHTDTNPDRSLNNNNIDDIDFDKDITDVLVADADTNNNINLGNKSIKNARPYSAKKQALELITSWANGTLDLCDPGLSPVQEFRLTPTEYKCLLEEIESDPSVFGFFEDKISATYSKAEQTFRLKMPHQMHQCPLTRLLVHLDTFLNACLANFPDLQSDLEVSGNTPFTFFSDQQHAKRMRQQKERKDFAKRIERVSSTRNPISPTEVQRRNAEIDAMYDPNTKPKGVTRAPDVYVFFASMLYPCLCFEVSWSQSLENVQKVAATYLRRSRSAVRIVGIVDIHYNKTKNKHIDPDQSVWIRLYKLVHRPINHNRVRDDVVAISEVQVQDFNGNMINSTTNCIDIALNDFFPRFLTEPHKNDPNMISLLGQRYILTTQRMHDILAKAKKLQDRYETQTGMHELSPELEEEEG
ncbi:hypothetical protein EAF00_012060 [Botryotinia globosa]|nr:hypothetical protein EAF00_012060 [Botryotinia globosa]